MTRSLTGPSVRCFLFAGLVALVNLVVGGPASSQCRVLEKENLAGPKNGTGGTFAAVDLSRDGNWLVIGVPGGIDTLGHVEFHDWTGDSPVLDARIHAATGSTTRIGETVAIDATGSRAVVGIPPAGRVHVYDRGAGGWSLQEVIAGSNRFGEGLALSDDGKTLAVSGRNGVAVFREAGGAWSNEHSIGLPSTVQGFEHAVSMDASGSIVAAGSQTDGAGGIVRVLEDPGAGPWTDTTLASTVLAGDRLGASLALSADGSTLLAGAPGSDALGPASGACFVFERQSGAWAQTGMITAGDAQDRLGESVALSSDGSTAVVGAPRAQGDSFLEGTAWWFERGAGSWSSPFRLSGRRMTLAGFFGSPVALDGVGVKAVTLAPQNAYFQRNGRAYFFDGFQRRVRVPEDVGSIQAAIDAACGPDVVVVGPGVWTESLDFHGRDVLVESTDGADVTVLDGAGSGPVVSFTNGETSAAELRGFTVRGGAAPFGGGVLVRGSAPTIAHCRIEGNQAGLRGGGIDVGQGADAQVLDSLVVGNAAPDGGGIGVGGGSRPRIRRTVLAGNFASQYGGGLHVEAGGDPLVESSLIEANGAREGAAAVVRSTARFVNCTVVENEATLAIGGLWSDGAGVRFENGILWDNRDAVGATAGQQLVDTGAASVVRYSDVQHGWSGAGNVDVDPLFVDPSGGDWRLGPTSPCIDAGDVGALPPFALADLAGVERRSRSCVVQDTGLGPEPFVDMGAYEWGTLVVERYCVPTKASIGCLPRIDWTGFASFSAGTDDFFVSASQLINGRLGAFFWSLAPAQAPFAGGTRCVQQPLRRTIPVSTGGSAAGTDCSGTLLFHFTQAYMANQGLMPGTEVYGQFWFRDPKPGPNNDVGLTNGVRFFICL